MDEQPYKPLKSIDYIEWNVQQFTHLSSMNILVLNSHLFGRIRQHQPFALVDEEDTEDVHCHESLERNSRKA